MLVEGGSARLQVVIGLAVRVCDQVLVRVNYPPSGGNCTVAPSSGRALDTIFQMRSHNWVDVEGHYPLSYQYYVVRSSGRVTGVSGPQASPLFNVRSWVHGNQMLCVWLFMFKKVRDRLVPFLEHEPFSSELYE